MKAILGSVKIERMEALRVVNTQFSPKMRQSKPSAFSNMNRRRTPPSQSNEYRAWKKKEEAAKEVNMASFSDFPDLVTNTVKKPVFAGTSLATKLKEVIQAEEEAAIMKRLKKGETPESILRESCKILSYSGGKKMNSELQIPDWLTDTTEPVVFPSFKHKTLEQLEKERKWKRYGIRPSSTMLYNIDEPEFIDDKVSLPDISESVDEEHTEIDVEEAS